jgi:hypothetical protein
MTSPPRARPTEAIETLPARALTLWQPWAWLVATGVKPIENRPQGFSHKSFRGDFWIHAATESTKQIASFLDADRLSREILGESFRIPDATTLTYGAIIGRATITGIMPPRTTAQNLAIWDAGVFLEKLRPWHFPDQYGFKVENARPLAVPVPCRGYQGFWRVPPDTLALLDRAIAQAEGT